jgi:hypothetical protein
VVDVRPRSSSGPAERGGLLCLAPGAAVLGVPVAPTCPPGCLPSPSASRRHASPSKRGAAPRSRPARRRAASVRGRAGWEYAERVVITRRPARAPHA